MAKANQTGIASFSAQQITAAQSDFSTYATKTKLSIKVPGAPSSFGDLLGSIVTDSGQQSAFIGAFLDPTLSGADLWTKAAAAGITADKIAPLKVQGKLAFLTLNNAALVQKVQQTLGSNDLGALADADFHLPGTWTNTINSIAGTDPKKLQY